MRTLLAAYCLLALAACEKPRDRYETASPAPAAPAPVALQSSECVTSEKARTVGFICEEGGELQEAVDKYLIAHPCVELSAPAQFPEQDGYFYMIHDLKKNCPKQK